MSHLRHALRQLAQSPGFTAVAVQTLALGVGLSSSSFSLANAFRLRALPYPESDRLVRIFRTSRQELTLPHPPANALDLQDSATSFAATAIYTSDRYALGEPGQPAEQVLGLAVAPGYFSLLGLPPALGRVNPSTPSP